jgi:hypothetical protein
MTRPVAMLVLALALAGGAAAQEPGGRWPDKEGGAAGGGAPAGADPGPGSETMGLYFGTQQTDSTTPSGCMLKFGAGLPVNCDTAITGTYVQYGGTPPTYTRLSCIVGVGSGATFSAVDDTYTLAVRFAQDSDNDGVYNTSTTTVVTISGTDLPNDLYDFTTTFSLTSPFTGTQTIGLVWTNTGVGVYTDITVQCVLQ